MPNNIAGFRSFVLKRFPNIDSSQLQRLDKFVESKQLTSAEKKATDKLSNLEFLANQIKAKATEKRNVSGLGTGGPAELLSQLGTGGKFVQNVDELRSLASQVAAEIGFGEAGKQFTEPEKALLTGQIPQIDVREKRPGWLGSVLGLKGGTMGAVMDDEKRLVVKMNKILEAIQRKRGGETIDSFTEFTIEELE